MDANMRRLVENVRTPIHCPARRLDRENQPRLIFGDRSIYTHFTKGRVDLICTKVVCSNFTAVSRRRQSRESSQRRAVPARFECIAGEFRKLPILQIAKIVLNRELPRIESHASETSSVEDKLRSGAAPSDRPRHRSCHPSPTKKIRNHSCHV